GMQAPCRAFIRGMSTALFAVAVLELHADGSRPHPHICGRNPKPREWVPVDGSFLVADIVGEHRHVPAIGHLNRKAGPGDQHRLPEGEALRSVDDSAKALHGSVVRGY